MEIIFQNKREDFRAFSEYMIKNTAQGKILGTNLFLARQVWIITTNALLGGLTWGATGQWRTGLLVGIAMFLITDATIILFSGFKPRNYEGIQFYKRQEKEILPKELEMFLRQRTLTADEDWLEIRNSETIHRWRWRRVDQVSLTSNFIFIHVGNCPVVYVPKRDFPSEQSFIDFGKKLIDLREKHKDQPIGGE